MTRCRRQGYSYTNFSFKWSSKNTDDREALVLSTAMLAADDQQQRQQRQDKAWQHPLLSHNVTVTNTGKRSGATAVLAFIEGGDGSVTPLRSLIGFDRVFLTPGQSTIVVIETTATAFSLVEESGVRVMKAGDERILAVGGHGRNAARRQVRIEGPTKLVVDSRDRLKSDEDGLLMSPLPDFASTTAATIE